jgi:hypothetical protein
MVIEVEKEGREVRGGQVPSCPGYLLQWPVQILCPVDLCFLPPQEVHLVKSKDVDLGGARRVQDWAQKPENVGQLGGLTSVHRVPVRQIFLH